MPIAKEILEQYEHADMRMRLSMYLQYRDLRDEFLLIDMKKEDRKEATAGSFNERRIKARKLNSRLRRKFLSCVLPIRQ